MLLTAMSTKRRAISIALIGSPLTAALSGHEAVAQSSLPRVAYVLNGIRSNNPKGVETFLTQMRKSGWIEGKNVLIDVRETGALAEGVASAIAESLHSRPDVIVVGGSLAMKAAHTGTKTIPIVALSIGSPVEQGYAKSLSRPGGNVTGNALVLSVSDQKTIELIRTLLPLATRVAILINPANPLIQSVKKRSEETAASQGMQAIFVEVSNRGEFPSALSKLPPLRVDGLIVSNDALFTVDQQLIVDIVSQHPMPVIYPSSAFVAKGGLMSYSLDYDWLFSNAAKFVDRILRGQKPADMPFEQPNIYELAVNKRTAKAMGLQIPQSILLRADIVIE